MDAGDRGDVDDCSGATFQHVRQDMLAGNETARNIEIDGAMPGRLIEFDRPAHCRVTHIIVKDIDTSVLRDDIRYDLSDSFGVRDVTGVRRRRSPFPANDVHRFLCGVSI
jgi:hypothetical protein